MCMSIHNVMTKKLSYNSGYHVDREIKGIEQVKNVRTNYSPNAVPMQTFLDIG